MGRLWSYAERKRLSEIRTNAGFNKSYHELSKAELREQLRQALLNTANCGDRHVASVAESD